MWLLKFYQCCWGVKSGHLNMGSLCLPEEPFCSPQVQSRGPVMVSSPPFPGPHAHSILLSPLALEFAALRYAGTIPLNMRWVPSLTLGHLPVQNRALGLTFQLGSR